jgi:hypothetical protein
VVALLNEIRSTPTYATHVMTTEAL